VGGVCGGGGGGGPGENLCFVQDGRKSVASHPVETVQVEEAATSPTAVPRTNCATHAKGTRKKTRATELERLQGGVEEHNRTRAAKAATLKISKEKVPKKG
jgi:hypothetical protein